MLSLQPSLALSELQSAEAERLDGAWAEGIGALSEASGGRLQQVNLDVGVTALVLRDERSEKVLNHLRGSAHAQRSGIASFERVRSFPKRCRVFQESATAPQKVFTFRG